MTEKKSRSGDGVVKEGLQRIGGLSGFARTKDRRDSPFNFGGGANAALREDAPEMQPSGTVDLRFLTPSRFQPRRYFDDERLADLAASIKEHGILQPLIVRKLGESEYEVIAGERRMRAAELAGLVQVPVVIKDLDDDSARKLALIENLQRDDLNPIEETESLLDLLSFELSVSKKQVVSLLYQLENADKGRTDVGGEIRSKIETTFSVVGGMKWQSFVRTRLPLLHLPVDVLEVVRKGSLSYTKAIAIAAVKSDQDRGVLLVDAVEEKLSIREIKRRIKILNSAKLSTETPKKLSLGERLVALSRNSFRIETLSPQQFSECEVLVKGLEDLLR